MDLTLMYRIQTQTKMFSQNVRHHSPKTLQVLDAFRCHFQIHFLLQATDKAIGHYPRTYEQGMHSSR